MVPAGIVAVGSVAFIAALRRLGSVAADLQVEMGSLSELRRRVMALRADADDATATVAQLRERGLPQLRR